MKCALLSLHHSNYASRRLFSEAAALGMKMEMIDPQNLFMTTAQAKIRFDITLNRLSVVEMNDFYSSLLHQDGWGRQVNSLALKLQWRDKAHQLLWLNQQGFATIPFFSLRGAPQRFHSQLTDFFCLSDSWVLKMNRGQRGIGVHVLNNSSEVEGWLETLYRMGDQDFILQPQLKLINEWRVSLIGKEFVYVLKRDHQSGKANAHAHQGVEWVKDVPAELMDLIERFKQSVSYDYLALDILEDESGLYINDLNTTMGFEQLEKITSYNIARLILEQSIRASH